MLSRSIRLMAFAFLVAALSGCGAQSPESRRKEAQANADKYWEYLRANDPEGAYKNTFSENYKRNLPLENFLKFQRGLTERTGAITSYTVVRYDADPQKQQVALGYSVQTEKLSGPAMFEIKMAPEGSEWRVESVEPKQMPTPPQQQPAPPQTAPPGGANRK